MIEEAGVAQPVVAGGRAEGSPPRLRVIGSALKSGVSASQASDPEQVRLTALFEKLRTKLLDLTLRNPMLNYKPQAKSRRHLRVVDDILEDAFKRLVIQDIDLAVVALPEPADVPADERTAEFESHLAYLKSTDQKYLDALKDLAARGQDNEFEIAKLERPLRDEARRELGLPARPSRKQIDLAAHAREFDIDPSEEMQPLGEKAGRRRKQVQTLLFPKDLQTRLEGIQDIARLSKQEMGLSTLFLAFGFLEWYATDESDKANFAPLLLLPVTLDETVENGKKKYSIKSTSEAAETNVTLAKYVEEFGRQLPRFEPDEQCKTPVEDYLAAVTKTFEGLKRWRVRRFITLGHFAFGRLAMYQDIDPASWPDGAVSRDVVGGILRGTEKIVQDDGDAMPKPPTDYNIDTPEIEKFAPLLVHDADASQHSAIVDVIKGENLVIEGPPGTGKSQTITNIIANALSKDGTTTVLFLSEKLAALEVVKRRLDIAGLGNYCLELHSEKSSPKSVAESLRLRCENPNVPKRNTRFDRGTWEASRAEVSDYLDALHGRDEAGATAFELFWRTIAADTAHDDVPKAVRDMPIPEHVLVDATMQKSLENQLEFFGDMAEGFSLSYGRPSDSPWRAAGVRATPGQSSDVVDAVIAMREPNSRLADLDIEAGQVGLSLADLFAIAERIASIDEPPELMGVEAFAALPTDRAMSAIELAEKLRLLEEQIATDPVSGAVDDAGMNQAERLAACLWDPAMVDLRAGEIRGLAEVATARAQRVLARIAGTANIRQLLGLDEDTSLGSISTACAAALMAAAVAPELRPWLKWRPGSDDDSYGQQKARWASLSKAEEQWTARFAGYDGEFRPDPVELKGAAKLLGDSLARFKPWKKKAWKDAVAVASALGVEANGDGARTLAEFADHVAAVRAFESDDAARQIVGPLWQGMRTEFHNMDWALNSRKLIAGRLAELPDGARIVSLLHGLNSQSLDALAVLKVQANQFLKTDPEDADWAAGKSVGQAHAIVMREARMADAAMAIAAGMRIDDAQQPLSAILGFKKKLDERAALVREVTTSPGGGVIQSMVARQGDSERLAAVVRWIGHVREAGLPALVTDRLLNATGGQSLADFKSLCGRATSARNEFASAAKGAKDAHGFDLPLSEPSTRDAFFADLIGHRQELPYLLDLDEARQGLEKNALGGFLAALEETSLPAKRYAEVFRYVVTRRRAERAKKGSQRLNNATDARLNSRRGQFAGQDSLKIERDRNAAAIELEKRKPVAGSKLGPRKTWTEMAFVTNEYAKSQRFSSVRTMLHQAPISIRALKPCFMMSPLSVSKFLPKDMHFDLVIIDEASQMRPEDALGALLRAKQIVVVGDPKQLPPTDFFNRAGDEDDTSDDVEDIQEESILEACNKSFNKVRRLKWHYRSRCESLIAFSNEQFYDKGLITFPMASPDSFSVDFVRVDGIYEAKQNGAEAQRICEEAIGFMNRFADAPDKDFGTIGVVALNSTQRDRIQEEFRRLSDGDPVVEAYMERAEKRGEPFFVKNLENVQGDERDFVMISLTYGRQAGKKAVSQSFGPINRAQGHRRLNVLFSRARRRIGLFTSMRSIDITPTPTSSRGVHVLKAYLEYAERGKTAPGAATGRTFDSDFEEEVFRRLTARGYQVDTQVGVSRFRIDLGVKHPNHPSVYVAGVECDGATYHSSKSARDRDRLREEVLRGLGWDIVRIWSTDWFSDPDAATEKLLRQIKELEARPLRAADEVMFSARPQNGFDTDIQPEEGDEIEPPEEAAPVPTKPATTAIASRVAPPSRPEIVLTKKAVQPDLFIRTNPSQSDLFVGGATSSQNEPMSEKAPAASMLNKPGKLTSAEARQALIELRGEIEAATPQAEAHRGILRNTMIDHFLKGGQSDDPQQRWFRLPSHLRVGTDPVQKREYLERICDVLDRMVV